MVNSRLCVRFDNMFEFTTSEKQNKFELEWPRADGDYTLYMNVNPTGKVLNYVSTGVRISNRRPYINDRNYKYMTSSNDQAFCSLTVVEPRPAGPSILDALQAILPFTSKREPTIEETKLQNAPIKLVLSGEFCAKTVKSVWLANEEKETILLNAVREKLGK